MKTIKMLFISVLVAGTMMFPVLAAAQVPDCSGEGPNRLGLVWPNGEFSYTAQPNQVVSATLYLFNPSEGDVRGWEFTLDFPSNNMFLLSSTLYGSALNMGGGNNFIVGLAEVLEPDPTGAVALGEFQFLVLTSTQLDFFGLPASPPSIPGNMAMLTGPNSSLVPMYPIGGPDMPLANLNGPLLDYCQGTQNLAPVAQDDFVTTGEDSTITFNIVDNDYDPDGSIDPQSVDFVTGPSAGGTFVNNNDGTVTYTPAADYFGLEIIQYIVADNQGQYSYPATIAVTVDPVNDPPVAVPETVETLEDESVLVDLLANDYDLDSDLSLESLVTGTPVNGGTLVNNGDGTVTYNPAPDFFGVDFFTYTIADIQGAVSQTVTDTVIVISVNDPPVAVAETGETPEDVPLTMNLVANDYDIDSEWNYSSVAVDAPVNGGTLVNHGDGTVTFTPAQDFFGFDYFSYTITDLDGAVSAAVNDTIFIYSVNDPPVAVADSVATLEDETLAFDILGNDLDVDGILDQGSVLFTGPSSAGGLFLYNGDGTVTYTPLPDYFGEETIGYTVMDDLGAPSAEGAIVVTVQPVNDAPVAVAETGETPEDVPVTMNLVANDYDIDSEWNYSSVAVGEPVNGGTLVNHGDGTVTFTPTPDFFGFDFFSYTITDVEGAVSEAVNDTVFIFSVNDPPVAMADTSATLQEEPVIIDLLANDYDVDGILDPLTLVVGESSHGGIFADNGDGTVTYTPQPGFFGEETCSYVVSDDLGLPCETPGLIVVQVTATVNTPPVIGDIPAQAVDLGQQFPPLDLSQYVTDNQDPATLFWEGFSYGDLSVTIEGNMALVTADDPAWFGSEYLNFVVTDDGELTDSAEVLFTVNNGFDLYVEIIVEETESYFTGTAPGATNGFDLAYDRATGGPAPTLVFDQPADMNSYAFVRHMVGDFILDINTATVDGVAYDIPFNRYRALPLGEFCVYECIWNEETQQYDCAYDCQYPLEGGKFYSIVQVPGGPDTDLMLVEDTDTGWLLVDTREPYDPLTEMGEVNFVVTRTNADNEPVPAFLNFSSSILPDDGISLKLWDATEGILFDLLPSYEYSYEVPAGATDARQFTLYTGTSVLAGDTDGDGVPDDVDECPGEDASFFDRDGDGCIDPVIGARHIEYWAAGTFPLAYYIHEAGAPDITDGSDMLAVQEGFAAWTEIEGCEITTSFAGTTADPIANSLDRINTVTFSDTEYPFPSGVIAVGLSTSFLEADQDSGTRPGQIIDTDMIFNPLMDLRTDTEGPPDGTYIKGVVVHEAGHMLGLSHSGVQSSTMFYVLPPDTTAVSLEVEDRLAAFKSYYTLPAYDGASHLRGSVSSGWTGEPVSGAIVFVMDAASGDTVACDFTLPVDGSYHFLGLPDGSYNLAIHPLNGSSAIGYLFPGNINAMIMGSADVLFPAEYWDAAESNDDDGTAMTAVSVLAGSTTVADFITNVDLVGPVITEVSPGDGATEVPIDAAVIFRCNEPIDASSLVGNFNLSVDGVGTLLPGNAALIEDGRTLAYVPTVNLEFATTYRLEVGGDLADLYGNPMGTAFTTTFTTATQPAVALDNLIPRKSVAGSILVINGDGFSSDLTGNVVTYGTETWPVVEAEGTQLVVQLPEVVDPGTANLSVEAFGNLSNQLSFTVLPPGGEAHGVETAAVDLFALPRRVEVSPDGDFAYVSTDQGLAYVDVTDPTSPVAGSLPVAGGLNRLDVSPDGQSVYAVSKSNSSLHRIGTNPVAELDVLDLDFVPQGIIVGPSGRRAYLATDYREIQVWNIDESSSLFLTQIGAMYAPDPNLVGAMATDPAGNYLLALDGGGRLLVFDLTTFTLAAEVSVLSDARDVVVDPQGQRAYVTDDSGYLSLVSMSSFSKLLDIPTGGSLKGVAIDPMGSLLYAVNHQLDNLDVIDLRSESPTYRTISARLPQQTNPVDVSLSPDGLYAYCIVQTDRRLAINTVGTGPMLASLSRRSGPVGARVVLAGQDFTGGTVSFNGVPADVTGSTDSTFQVFVPEGATSGPVMVLGEQPGEVSNAISFQVVEESPPGNLRLASALQPPGTPALTGEMGITSNDRLAVVGAQDGTLQLLDIDPASMDFNQFIGQTEALAGPVQGLALAPDGLSAFAVTSGASLVTRFNINPVSATFGGVIDTIVLDVAEPRFTSVSPDGRYVLASDQDSNRLHVINWDAGTTVTVAVPGLPGRAVYHPGGQYAYVIAGSSVLAVNLDPDSEAFGTIEGSAGYDATPTDLAFSPDGDRCFVLTGPVGTSGDRTLFTLDTVDPWSPVTLSGLAVATASAPMDERLVLSPAGDRALLNIMNDGLVLVDLLSSEISFQPELIADGAPLGIAFTNDGNRVLAATSSDGSVSVLDFNGQQRIARVWGNNQTGRAGQNLASTLRVRVTDPITGEGLAGVPVTFTIDTSGKAMAYTSSPVFTPARQPATGLKKKPAPIQWLKAPAGQKDGGEDLADATVISSLPFSDTGSTAGHLDDYDETCPHDAPGSPDVVYLWTADFTGSVAVDLCGSGYDTKLYVYADAVTPGSPWACNDDYYSEDSGCGNFVSLIDDMFVFAGTTYIIVVDGYNGDAGPFSLSVTQNYVSTPWGFFVSGDPQAVPTTRTVGSGPLGYAEVQMNLGLNLGDRTVGVSCLGAEGSPLQFTETAVANPEDITFALVESKFAPLDGSVNVDVNTAILITFSKAMDPLSVTPARFYLSPDGGTTALPAAMGFGSGNTTASLTPGVGLQYGFDYQVIVGTGIVSESGEPLTNPVTFGFTTRPAPAGPALAGLSPPGGPPLAPVMISGSGFSPDPAQNAVFFGGTQAVITAVESDYLLTKVPLDLVSGEYEVQATVGGQPTNTLPFSVFQPSDGGSDEVVLQVPVGSSPRSVTVSPDGAMIYAVSPEADLVTPLDMEEFTTAPGIPVGDTPWAISSHPEGKLVYVANRMSGDVSVIDTDPASPTYHQAVGSIDVGLQPVDILVTPDGSRVLVANDESQELSVIDSDAESSSFNYVLHQVPVGSGARSVTISPDGARIYLGTDDGYVLIGAVDYGVMRYVPTGSTARSVTVSPDGALLVLLDTEGEVSIFDIAEGSPTEDQVMARVPVGQGVRSTTISPDGARLYAVMDEGDVINVYAIEIDGGVGVIGEPDPRPIPELVLLDVLAAGENPQVVAFDPTDITRFVVPNAGDNTISVFDDEVPVSIEDGNAGILAGHIRTQGPGPESATPGARINLYSRETGEMVLSVLSGQDGAFSALLPAGRYVASMITPAGYSCPAEEQPIEIAAGQTLNQDWALEPLAETSTQRSMAWWKYQLAVVLRGWGQATEDGQALCEYLDAIDGGLAAVDLELAMVYQNPPGGECRDKLQAGGELFNFRGDWNPGVRARQQLMAALLNVASLRLSLQQVVSEDGTTASAALQLVGFLLQDGDPENDGMAWAIAQAVNSGSLLAAGIIAEGGENAFYSPVAVRFHLDQNYPNPFNPECRIRFGVPTAGRVRLRIYDISGRLVKTLVDESLRVGTYIRVWDGKDNRGLPSASGLYFYKMEARSFTQTRKMLLLK